MERRVLFEAGDEIRNGGVKQGELLDIAFQLRGILRLQVICNQTVG